MILAGNSGNSSNTADCTVWSPSTAIGAFTVGSHAETWANKSETNVRNDQIASYSSRGGTLSEGGGRKIVDITAFGCGGLLFDAYSGYSTVDCGTSYATPIVTASVLDLTDFWKTTYDNNIDDPGIKFVNMLLMGDRKGESGILQSGADGLWGMGRLQMRKFDASGLDQPADFGSGWVCISDGQTYDLAINGGSALPAAADVFKGAIYWFDRKQENASLTMDDIDLALVRADTGASLVWSNSGANEVERVYKYGVGGIPLKLRITGYDVNSAPPNGPVEDPGCGTNSQKVYYAYFWEDSARDDVDGPSSSEIDIE